MDSSSAASATSTSSPKYSVAQQLQNLAAQNSSSLLQSMGASESSPLNFFAPDPITSAAAQSLLMHAAPTALAPLIGNPELLGEVIDYRKNEKTQKDDSHTSTKTEFKDPSTWTKTDAAVKAKYLKMFPDVVVGNNLDASV